MMWMQAVCSDRGFNRKVHGDCNPNLQSSLVFQSVGWLQHIFELMKVVIHNMCNTSTRKDQKCLMVYPSYPAPKSHQQHSDVSIEPSLQFGLLVWCVISAYVRQLVVYLGLHAKQSVHRADMQIHNFDAQAWPQARKHIKTLRLPTRWWSQNLGPSIADPFAD